MKPALSRYWRRRLLRPLSLAVIAICLTIVACAAIPSPDLRHRLSMGTAYAALAFFAASLMLGPWRILRGDGAPVSYDQRRDVGMAAGILALLHTGIGLTVHLRGRMWMYFLKGLHPARLQMNTFGAANALGLLAAIILAMLLAISNDRSLSALGLHGWKRLQRWAYAAFALTLAHAICYQWVEKRTVPWVFCLAAISVAALLAQYLGYRQTHQRSSTR